MDEVTVPKRIPSGIPGLDDLVGGGFLENTVNLFIGSSGTGKTTAALQFAITGLVSGEMVLYISLELQKEDIFKYAEIFGWGFISEFYEKKLFIVEPREEELKDFIQKKLSKWVDRIGLTTNSRIIIDPLTPVLWNFSSKFLQRRFIREMFRKLACLGTILAIVEEHGETDEFSVPLYLSDSAFRLNYSETGRTIRVLKFRGSRHGEEVYPVKLKPGFGLIVQALEEGKTSLFGKRTHEDYFFECMNRIGGNKYLASILSHAQSEWDDARPPVNEVNYYWKIFQSMAWKEHAKFGEAEVSKD
jgi:KaiC/GvpD/RAD55 family RecA-like ATPase